MAGDGHSETLLTELVTGRFRRRRVLVTARGAREIRVVKKMQPYFRRAHTVISAFAQAGRFYSENYASR